MSGGRMMAGETCLTDGDLASLAGQSLAGPAAEAARLHIDHCAECRELVAALVVVAEPGDAESAARWRPSGEPSRRYVLHDELVRGGMGRILRAYDKVLERDVALKTPREEVAVEARFWREVAVLGRLSHPAIIAIHDAGYLGEDLPFFAMPLLSGETLAQALERPLDLRARLALTRTLLPVVNAVAYAHDHGTLHRDIKPHNVFLGVFGEATLLDWGLAGNVGAAARSATTPAAPTADPAPYTALTEPGARLGTLGFAAPEQLAGGAATVSSDVYGLGAILYHVMTGRPPPPDRVRPAVEVDPEIPHDLSSVIMRALSPEPAARFASARELAGELERFLDGAMVTSHRYSLRERLARSWRAHRSELLVTALATLVLLGGLVFYLMRIAEQRAIAHHERRLALDECDRSRALAEFVITDVRRDLDEAGRLDLLASLGDGIARYLGEASPLVPAPPPSEAGLRAKLHLMLGDIAYLRKQPAAAAERYRRARSLMLTDGAVGSAAARTRLELRLGDVHALEDDRVGRRAALAAASALAFSSALVSEVEPDELAELRGMVILERSRVALADGDARAADGLARDALATVADARPSSPDRDRRLAAIELTARLAISNHQLELGDVREALGAAEAAVAGARDLRARNPANADVDRYLATALSQLGITGTRAGQGEPARAALREAEGLFERLAAADPSNADLVRQQGALADFMGEAFPREQERWFGRSLEASRKIATPTPDDPAARRDLAVALIRMAGAATPPDRAAALADEAMRAAAPPADTTGDRSPVFDDVWYVELLCRAAAVARDSGQRSVATARLEHAAALARRAFASAEPSLFRDFYRLHALVELVEDRLVRGRTIEAAELRGELEAVHRELSATSYEQDEWPALLTRAGRLVARLDRLSRARSPLPGPSAPRPTR